MISERLCPCCTRIYLDCVDLAPRTQMYVHKTDAIDSKTVEYTGCKVTRDAKEAIKVNPLSGSPLIALPDAPAMSFSP